MAERKGHRPKDQQSGITKTVKSNSQFFTAGLLSMFWDFAFVHQGPLVLTQTEESSRNFNYVTWRFPLRFLGRSFQVQGARGKD